LKQENNENKKIKIQVKIGKIGNSERDLYTNILEELKKYNLAKFIYRNFPKLGTKIIC